MFWVSNISLFFYFDILKSPSPKYYITFLNMTKDGENLNWSDITPICDLITELDLISDFNLLLNFGSFP